MSICITRSMFNVYAACFIEPPHGKPGNFNPFQQTLTGPEIMRGAPELAVEIPSRENGDWTCWRPVLSA